MYFSCSKYDVTLTDKLSLINTDIHYKIVYYYVNLLIECCFLILQSEIDFVLIQHRLKLRTVDCHVNHGRLKCHGQCRASSTKNGSLQEQVEEKLTSFYFKGHSN